MLDLIKQQIVAEVVRVTGPYDVIAIPEAPDPNEISDIVTSDIHTLSGVVRTTTCVYLE